MRFLTTVLFCANTAALIAADAPRIVDVTELDRPPERLERVPIEIPESMRDAGTNDTVSLIAVIDTAGKVARLEDVKSTVPAAAEAVTAAVKRWAFSPGFVQSKPTSFRIPLAVAIRPALTPRGDSGDDITLEGDSGGPAFKTVPAYPEPLKASPVDGYAFVELTIDAEGKPSDPVVEYASRPEFAEAASAAVLAWIYTPAERAGKKVATRFLGEVRFTAESAAWTPEIRDLKARLQYARNYDDAPQEKKTGPVVFPYDALMANRGGGVTINVVIDPNGRVAQTMPGPGSDPDYVGAIQASLASWEFTPATKAGIPVFAIIAMQFNFDPYRQEFQFDNVSYELIKSLRDGTATIYSLKQVSQMPKPIQQVQPVLPVDYAETGGGDAMIEFIIDLNGRVQLPKVVRASHPALGWAAATAVAQWRFEPAQKDGVPVPARARQPIRFAPLADPATP